jgi:hypothetical protein
MKRFCLKLITVLPLVLMAVMVGYCVGTAGAVTYYIADNVHTATATNEQGHLQASLDYFYDNAHTVGVLTITLTNTGPGYLGAFVFNNPGNDITGVTLHGTTGTNPSATWNILGGTSFNNSINGAPYGNFDIGLSVSDSFQSGANQAKGIGGSYTHSTFTFYLTGSHLDTLTTDSFVQTFSSGLTPQFFAAHIFGTAGTTTSDKVGTYVLHTPIPPSALLLGSGLIGLTLMGLRRRHHS